jgi:hypothetical protein
MLDVRSGNSADLNPLAEIPEPNKVREQLASNLTEARLLRSLLRLSQRASDYRQLREKVTRV